MSGSVEQDAWVSRVLGIQLPRSPSNGTGVAFQQLRLQWDDARKQLREQVGRLEAAILEQSSEEEDFGAIRAQAERRLGDVLEAFDDRLSDALDALYNSGGQEGGLRRRAGDVVAEYEALITSDPLLQVLDTNPFIKVDAVRRLEATMTAISAQLQG